MSERPRSNISGWIFPAYRLMARLGYRSKFYLISAFTALPMLILSAMLLFDLLASIQGSAAVRERLQRIDLLNQLRWSVEDVRDLSVRRLLTGDTDVERMHQRALTVALSRLEQISPMDVSPLREAEQGYIERIRSSLTLDKLPPGSEGFRLTQVFDNANRGVEVVQEWLVTLSKQGTGLGEEPLAMRMELDLLSEQIYRLSRAVGSLRAYGVQLLENTYLDSDGAEVVDAALNELDRETQLLAFRLGQGEWLDASALIDSAQAVHGYVEDRLVNQIELDTPWHDYFARLTDALENFRRYESRTQEALAEALRVSAEKGFNLLVGLGMLLGAAVLVYVYLLIGLYISIMKSVVSLGGSARRVARGDLDSPIRCDSTDEMRIIAEAMESMRKQLQIRERELREISLIDGLTGLRNRRYFDESLLANFAAARRRKSMMAVALLDLDHFKSVNDRYGHAAGDHALQMAARQFRDAFRRERDVVARYGGEEFAVVLPDTTGEQAVELVERVRRQLEQTEIDFEGIRIPLTLSAGVGVFDGFVPVTAQALLRAADDALYVAKGSGRNQVVLAATDDDRGQP